MHGKICRLRRRAFAAGRVAVLAMVLAGAGFGCGASRPDSPFRSAGDQRLTIEVDNRNFLDATLHAVWPGTRTRLGTVIGITSANFRLAWSGGNLLQIEIDLLAGPSCITEPISANPGEIIVLHIPSVLRVGRDCF